MPWLASLLGIIIANLTAENYGRKPILIFNGINLFISQLLTCIAIPCNQIWLLILGRFLTGVNIGSSTVFILYIGEITSLKLRAAVTSSFLIWSNAGNGFSMAVSIDKALGGADTWHYVSLIGCGLSFLQFIFIKIVPESPTYLNRLGRVDEVKQILESLYGDKAANVDLKDVPAASTITATNNSGTNELHDISTEQPIPPKAKEPPFYHSLYHDRTLQKALFYQILLSIFAVLSGMLVITVYSTRIIRSFNFDLLTAQLITVGMTVFRTIGQALGTVTLRRWKRKTSLMVSYGGTCLSTVAMAVIGQYLVLEDGSEMEGSDTNNLALKIILIALILLGLASYSLGSDVIYLSKKILNPELAT